MTLPTTNYNGWSALGDEARKTLRDAAEKAADDAMQAWINLRVFDIAVIIRKDFPQANQITVQLSNNDDMTWSAGLRWILDDDERELVDDGILMVESAAATSNAEDASDDEDDESDGTSAPEGSQIGDLWPGTEQVEALLKEIADKAQSYLGDPTELIDIFLD